MSLNTLQSIHWYYNVNFCRNTTELWKWIIPHSMVTILLTNIVHNQHSPYPGCSPLWLICYLNVTPHHFRIEENGLLTAYIFMHHSPISLPTFNQKGLFSMYYMFTCFSYFVQTPCICFDCRQCWYLVDRNWACCVIVHHGRCWTGRLYFGKICLQETWTSNDSDLSLLQLPGYQLIHQGRKCTSHGGLMISLNQNYSYKLRNLYTNSNIWEGLFTNGSNLCRTRIIGNIYRPPHDNNNANNIQQFMSNSPLL